MNSKQLNILLADDDKDDCIFFKEALEGLEMPNELTIVHDGEQLMKLLVDLQGELPHVLFLDLNMPRKNGFECLAEIKQNEKLNLLSVIIFSTSFEQEVVAQLYQNGAHYFVRKPSKFSQFKKIIQHTIHLIADDLFQGNAESVDRPDRENFVLVLENEN